MSNAKFYSVYDSKANAFMEPWLARTAGLAMRQFEDSVNDGRSIVCTHPEDFTLFELGEFDQAKGALVSYATPKSLCRAQELKKTPDAQIPMPLDRKRQQPATLQQ